ncbi:MAG: tripartite tricarboxylate transporter substrate binding protein [Burkholderiaceae bacterium]|nr:tripartite tricarboxylate transporter substrate binding protein [Burkholderiaceae bacterium]
MHPMRLGFAQFTKVSQALVGVAYAIGMTVAGVAATVLPAVASAQALQGKPVSLIVGFAPGGSNDIAARIVAPYLGEVLGTTVVVENKTGASGMLAGAYVAKAAPDGHTMLLSSLSPVIISPQTLKKVPFHTPTDLAGINIVGFTPEAIAVGPTLPNVKTLADLIALSKERPITLSSSGTGGLPHLTIELLTQASKGKFTHVPYKGGGPASVDTVAGHVDGIVMDLPPLLGLIQDGRLRALALTSDKRVDFLPDVPTAQENLPNFAVVNWLGIFAPAKTPKAVIDEINAAIIKVVARPDVQEKLKKVAILPSTMESPAAFQQFVVAEYKRWGDVLKQAKIELE